MKSQAALAFLCGQISDNRGLLLGITHAAVSFGIRQSADGLTDWQTIYIEDEETRVQAGAVPITYQGRLALIFASEEALAAITVGESTEEISAEGDLDLLLQVSRCFSAPQSWLDLRSGR
jgi:hypothetical protein